MTVATDVALRVYRHDFWGIDQFLGDNLDEDGDDFLADALRLPNGRYVRPPDFRIGDEYLPVLIEGLRQARITALSLASCRRLTGSGVSALSAFPEVTFLDLFNTQLDDADLAVLADCRNLEVLNLAGTSITGPVLDVIATLPRLQTLHLGYTALASGAVAPLAGAPRLTVLNLASTPLGDNDTEAIATIATLRELGLEETQVGDRGVSALKPLARSLTRLHLGYTAVTDGCVPDLCTFSSLTRLQLRATRIDRGAAGAIAAAVAGLNSSANDDTARIIW
ncbi:Uncharacterised protein [Mycolicibacterium vanbaalenii]|uniref:Internalin-A n=1 Tax=Mycolicibacterium vanbaalenii TaxID=110539 RepID=A0A5S9RB07_MYCVN|nr:hypothetical protein [Mycolicibacterium vanbaalenii]CAA0134757.1 Uncharacterised protein [Mycolicibacterium vanbaalenii]